MMLLQTLETLTTTYESIQLIQTNHKRKVKNRHINRA